MGFPNPITSELGTRIIHDYVEEQVSIHGLNKKYSICNNTLVNYLKRNGVTIRSQSQARFGDDRPFPAPASDEAISEMVAMYNEGTGLWRISKLLGVSKAVVHTKLKNAGVLIRGQDFAVRNRCRVNHAAFSSAETNEAAAYFVGLLMTDGCIVENQPGSWACRLRLCKIDGEIVESFRVFMQSSHKVTCTKPHQQIGAKGKMISIKESVGISITSNQICSDLARYGVTPRKTHTAEVKVLENNRHFWRGCVDGDGSLSLRVPKGRSYAVPSLYLCGSEGIVHQFARYIENVLGILCLPKQQKVSTDHWRACYWSSKAIAIVNHLYSDCSIALPRKLRKAVQIQALGVRVQNIIGRKVQ